MLTSWSDWEKALGDWPDVVPDFGEVSSSSGGLRPALEEPRPSGHVGSDFEKVPCLGHVDSDFGKVPH